MKTLFIQTHELAASLDPNYGFCYQTTSIIGIKSKYDGEFYSLYNSCLPLVISLFKEQKEYRKWCSKSNEFLSQLFFLEPQYWGEGINNRLGRTAIRQRLINSLLTRPDRTLCVLIPE